MKIIVLAILAGLALGVAFGATPEPENLWVNVEGGSWEPGTEIIARIKGQVAPYVSGRAEGRKFREWATYTFQYQGQEESGKKFVFVNAFCISAEDWPLTKRMMTVTDGGTCFFNVKFDPGTSEFFELHVHADA